MKQIIEIEIDRESGEISVRDNFCASIGCGDDEPMTKAQSLEAIFDTLDTILR